MYHDLKEIFIDDDQDSIIFVVDLKKPDKGGNKASCHVGYKSCFYRRLNIKKNKIVLEFTEKKKAFDPDIIYKGIPNPTKILLPSKTILQICSWKGGCRERERFHF